MDRLSYCPCCASVIDPDAAECLICGCAIGAVPDVMGKLLRNGDLRLVRRLDRGGMAILYLAEVTATGEPRVVKELRASSNRRARTTLEQMFHEEAALMDRLSQQHLAVPRYYDSFMDSGAFYMVIEYVPGENLADYLAQREAPVPINEALDYARQIAAVLRVLHELQPAPVIHGDIKPSNLIRRPEGDVVLIDFGLARLDAPMPPYVPAGTSAFGTPGYSPVEQWEGHPGPAADVFALGATLHHLLTGRDPREAIAGRSRLSRTDISLLTTFPPLRSLVPAAPAMLDLLIAQMLRRRAAERPPIGEVCARLDLLTSLLPT